MSWQTVSARAKDVPERVGQARSMLLRKGLLVEETSWKGIFLGSCCVSDRTEMRCVLKANGKNDQSRQENSERNRGADEWMRDTDAPTHTHASTLWSILPFSRPSPCHIALLHTHVQAHKHMHTGVPGSFEKIFMLYILDPLRSGAYY